LTVGEPEERVGDLLKEEYEVGYVDVELDDEEGVEFLGLGRGMSGIGPTLVPGTCAVALYADPAYSSSPGDTVQHWKRTEDETTEKAEGEGNEVGTEGIGKGGEMERVAVGELGGATGDVVTVDLTTEM